MSLAATLARVAAPYVLEGECGTDVPEKPPAAELPCALHPSRWCALRRFSELVVLDLPVRGHLSRSWPHMPREDLEWMGRCVASQFLGKTGPATATRSGSGECAGVVG